MFAFAMFMCLCVDIMVMSSAYVLLVLRVSDVYMLSNVGDNYLIIRLYGTPVLIWRIYVLFLNVLYALRHLI